jgi:transcriptional regulator of NAD metabolism
VSSERRKKLLELLRSADEPLSGSQLAERVGVSRQTIVQDIAFLRKDGHDIVSTTHGYVCTESPQEWREVLGIIHTPEQLRRELEILVAHHVRVEDVFIDHPIYGRIRGVLGISTPKDVKNFVEKRDRASIPLFSEVSGGLHYHTVSSEDPENIADAKKALQKEGFRLVEYRGE